MHEDLYPEESERLIQLASQWARERGFAFPLPARVLEVHHPVTHWEVLSAGHLDHRTCVMIDPCSQLLNVELRPAQSAPPQTPWWKRLLGLSHPPR